MKNIVIALVIINMIVASTVLISYRHGDVVATCFGLAFFLFVMLEGSA